VTVDLLESYTWAIYCMWPIYSLCQSVHVMQYILDICSLQETKSLDFSVNTLTYVEDEIANVNVLRRHRVHVEARAHAQVPNFYYN